MPVGIYQCKLDNAENSFSCIIAKKDDAEFFTTASIITKDIVKVNTYNKTTPPTNSQYLFKEAPLELLTQRGLGGKSRRRRRRNRSTKRRYRKSSKRFS